MQLIKKTHQTLTKSNSMTNHAEDSCEFTRCACLYLHLQHCVFWLNRRIFSNLSHPASRLIQFQSWVRLTLKWTEGYFTHKFGTQKVELSGNFHFARIHNLLSIDFICGILEYTLWSIQPLSPFNSRCRQRLKKKSAGLMGKTAKIKQKQPNVNT